MGYSVGEGKADGDVEIIAVCLITNNAQVYMTHIYPEDFQKDYIIETVVGKINDLIREDK